MIRLVILVNKLVLQNACKFQVQSVYVNMLSAESRGKDKVVVVVVVGVLLPIFISFVLQNACKFQVQSVYVNKLSAESRGKDKVVVVVVVAVVGVLLPIFISCHTERNQSS